jgi:hypothetical protein
MSTDGATAFGIVEGVTLGTCREGLLALPDGGASDGIAVDDEPTQAAANSADVNSVAKRPRRLVLAGTWSSEGWTVAPPADGRNRPYVLRRVMQR